MKKTILLLCISSTLLCVSWLLILLASYSSLSAMEVNSPSLATLMATGLFVAVDLSFLMIITQPFFEGRITLGQLLFLLFALPVIGFTSYAIWQWLLEITSLTAAIAENSNQLIITIVMVAVISILKILLLVIFARLWIKLESYLPSD